MPGLKKVVTSIQARIDAAKSDGGEGQPWIRQVAMLTGVLAALSGFLAVRSTMLTNDAIYESNQAILAQAQSSDAWAEYQADSIKARIVETALAASGDMAPDKRSDLEGAAAELRGRQPDIKKTAVDRADARDQHLKTGLNRLAERDLLGFAGLAAQIGIALASVAALVRVRVAFHAGLAAGGIGIALMLYAFAVQYGVLSF